MMSNHAYDFMILEDGIIRFSTSILYKPLKYIGITKNLYQADKIRLLLLTSCYNVFSLLINHCSLTDLNYQV